MSDLEQEQTVASGTERVRTSISVVIVSYNSRQLLRDCLLSVKAEPWEQVIVVDNSSSDGSAAMVTRKFPWVKLILSEKNNGYGAAANLAMASCASKYTLLLNSDTLLRPGTLQTLVEYLDQHPQAAIVGPRLVNADGTDQLSLFEFPTPLQALRRETRLSCILPGPSRLSFYKSSDGSVQAVQIVPWVLGAALAIRRAAFEAVGGFDESFFMYYEEVDLCYRLKQIGWQTHFAQEASVIHVGGASTKHHRAAMLQQLYKSLCHFYQQHYSGRQKKQLRLVLTYLMLRNILKDKLRSYRSAMNDQAIDDLAVWRSILASLWSKDTWLKD